MRRALGDYEIAGVPTTIPFHQRVMEHPAFVAGEAATTFLVDHPDVVAFPAVEHAHDADATNPEFEPERTKMVVEVDGRRFDVTVSGQTVGTASNGRPRTRRPGRTRSAANTATAGNDLVSPIQGTVLRVAVEVGQQVAMGDLVCVVEAMKMENELTAHRDGVVKSVDVETGGAVRIGAVVATIE
jgi:acetyl-CoA/propionyl-CoA carboxylase biotin carboxyl carrier protein